jgi:hypothetical protein
MEMDDRPTDGRTDGRDKANPLEPPPHNVVGYNERFNDCINEKLPCFPNIELYNILDAFLFEHSLL